MNPCDPRLRARRAGPQDVEVAGQRGGTPGGDEASTAPTSCALGRRLRLCREDLKIGAEILKAPGGGLSPAAQTPCAISWARSTASTSRSASARGDAGAGALVAASPGRDRRADAADDGGFRFPQQYTALHNFLRGGSLRLLFRHPKDALYCDAGDGAAPARGAYRAERGALPSHRPGLAPSVLHRRGGVAAPAMEGRRGERASARLSGGAGGMARRGAGAQKWARIRDCAGSSPARWRSSARKSASAPACRAHPVVHASPSMSRRCTASTSAEIAINLVGDAGRRPVPAGAFTLPDVPDVGVMVTAAEGDKCERCWRVLPEVGPHAGAHGGRSTGCSGTAAPRRWPPSRPARRRQVRPWGAPDMPAPCRGGAGGPARSAHQMVDPGGHGSAPADRV